MRKPRRPRGPVGLPSEVRAGRVYWFLPFSPLARRRHVRHDVDRLSVGADDFGVDLLQEVKRVDGMVDLLVHAVFVLVRLVALLLQLRIAGLLRRRAPVEARIHASRPRVGSLTDRPLALVEGQHGALQKLLERFDVRRAHGLLQRDELVLPSTSGVLDAGV